MAENVLAFNFLAKDNFSGVADKVSRKLDGVGGKLAGFGKMAGLALGGAAVTGVAAFGAAMVKGVKDAEDYQTLALKTAAVIKSTGNQAHISVKGIQTLAASLESMSGVDETLIINSENVLATFTNIRNMSGKNNDVFNQATKAALNLSVAMGGDLQGATVQVGKALNDPIKGITALQRVGVTFNAQQKAQIATMVKNHNTMGAQKIILRELNKEFGGAAKAAGAGFGGSMARLQDIIGDTFRSLGMALLPTLTKVADWLTTVGVPAVIAFGQKIGPYLSQGFQILGKVIGAVVGWVMNNLVPAFQGMAQHLMPIVQQAIKGITSAFHDHQDVIAGVVTFFKFLGTVVTKVLIPALGILYGYIIKYIPVVIRIVLTVIGAVFTVIAAIIKYTPRVASAIVGVVTTITRPFITAGTWLYNAGRLVLTGLINGLRFIFVTIPQFMAGVVISLSRPFIGAAVWLVQAGRNVLTGLWNGLIAVGRSIASWFTGGGGLVSRIKGFFSGAKTWLAQAGKDVLWGFLHGLQQIWTSITGWVSGIATWIKDHKGPVSLDAKLLIPAGRAIMTGFFNGLKSGAGKAWSFVKSVGGKTVAELSDALGFTGAMGNMGVQGGGNSSNKAIGQKMNAAMGWGAYWPALNNLWMGESGWNQNARNASSGAYGIPQSLPASKMASAGSDYLTNAVTQIRWGLGYIAAAYGNPANAYAKWLSRSPHWYDSGGLARGPGFIPKLTNAPERVLSPRQTAWFERAMAAGVRGGGGGVRGTEAHFHFYNYVGNRNDLMRVLNQAARTGQLDAIVRMSR